MAMWSGGSRSITDRLDAVRFELKAEIAGSELRLSEKIQLSIDPVKGALAELTQEFKEFRGLAKGVVIVISTLVPLVTAVLVVVANRLTGH